MQRLRDEMCDLQKGAAHRISECESELVRAPRNFGITRHTTFSSYIQTLKRYCFSS